MNDACPLPRASNSSAPADAPFTGCSLAPRRALTAGRALTRPGTLLPQQIPIRGSVGEEGRAGWVEVDTVAGQFRWMVDGGDHATTWAGLWAITAAWKRFGHGSRG